MAWYAVHYDGGNRKKGVRRRASHESRLPPGLYPVDMTIQHPRASKVPPGQDCKCKVPALEVFDKD